MAELLSMFTERWYVLAFLVSFLVIATAERGWQRTAFWLVSGTVIGWLMEFSSLRNGFPFGDYVYHEKLFPDELFIGGVPLFASLSFAFLTYFGYSVACTLLSPLVRRGGGVQRAADPGVDSSIVVLALAAIIITWVDVVIDPVTHLGRYWLLGDLYAYSSDGFHLDVPLSNYAGWLFTSVFIVFVNQTFDVLLRARGNEAGGFALPFKPFWAPGAVFGTFVFMIAVSLYLVASDSVPSDANAGGVLMSGLVFSVGFLLFAAFMIWRGLERGERMPPAGMIAPAANEP